MEGKNSCPSLQPRAGGHPGKAGCSSFVGPPTGLLGHAFEPRPGCNLCLESLPLPLTSLSSKSSPNGPSSEKPSRFLWAHTPFCRTVLFQKLLGSDWHHLSGAPTFAAAAAPVSSAVTWGKGGHSAPWRGGLHPSGASFDVWAGGLCPEAPRAGICLPICHRGIRLWPLSGPYKV